MADTGAQAAILDIDPDLGAGIDGCDWGTAREACRGRLVHLPTGICELAARDGARGQIIGWLIARGLMCREVALCDRHILELLPPGDVLQPPVAAGEGPALGGSVVFTASDETALVELGEPFLRASARWPCLLAEVNRRLEVQRQHLAIQGAIAHLPRAEHRLLLAVRHLADRWGRVTADGTLLPLPLTHEVLGHMTAARRSTVSLAAAALDSDGCLRRLDDGSWLVTAAGEEQVQAIAANGQPRPPLSEAFLLRQRAGVVRDESRARVTRRQLGS